MIKPKPNSLSVNVILDETQKMNLWRRAASATLKTGQRVTISDIVREILGNALCGDAPDKPVSEIINETPQKKE